MTNTEQFKSTAQTTQPLAEQTLKKVYAEKVGDTSIENLIKDSLNLLS